MATRPLLECLDPQARRFFDGGTDDEAPDPGADPRIVLERHMGEEPMPRAESFSMARRIGYRDREVGRILVPSDLAGFRTDLASVPALFTWLVPRTGAHLPAALLHDGLVGGHDRDDGASYVAEAGEIDRVTADRIFRDAMADTGTGLVRRWIVWAAVTVVTLLLGKAPGGSARRWGLRAIVAGSIAFVVWLGHSATADLLDRSWPLAVAVPWMGERAWWLELVGGFAGAVVIPLLLSLLWAPYGRAGAIFLVLLALLLHVSAALLAISLGYLALEWVGRRSPTLLAAVLGAVGVASVVVFCLWWTG